jgi:glycosyltransferase involved in cell wall biosynthesis
MKPDKFPITLFIGVFNAEKYMKSVLDQLISQDNQNFKILLVNNSSKDNTMGYAGLWKKIFSNRVRIIENNINYGAYGSLFRNLNKIHTDWFAWIHQDDYYKSNHLSTILDLISQSDSKTVGVSTTMGSMSDNGKKLNSKPRSTWFSSNLDQAGQFLQNLKSQAVPDPASAFRLESFKKVRMPIHSSSFPDTEHTLRLLGYGTFLVSQKETMLYRENPKSISHAINDTEREIGTSVSLIRVFSSIEFEKILNTITEDKQGDFTKKLLKALQHRFPEGAYLRTIEIFVLERIIEIWGYTNFEISQKLFQKYSEFSSPLTLNTINNLSGTNFKSSKQILKSNYHKPKLSIKIWDKYFNLQLGIFKKFNKFLLKMIYTFIFIIKPNHRLRTKWK